LDETPQKFQHFALANREVEKKLVFDTCHDPVLLCKKITVLTFAWTAAKNGASLEHISR
jgi:hypothetical protein